jgi:hypothetical protein
MDNLDSNKVRRKSGLVWTVFCIFCASVAGELLTAIAVGVLHKSYYANSTALNVIAIILLVVDIVISSIYLYKLYSLKSDVLFWTNAVFGYAICRSIFAIFADIILAKGTVYANIFEILIVFMIWLLFYRHLKTVLTSTLLQN